MPFVCGGYPGPGSLARLLPALSSAGAAVIEVGIPFSDPIADGPIIAAAMHDAIERGATPPAVIAEIAEARAHTTAAIVAMVSYSLVRRATEARFVASCATAGVDGLIIPDLPLEEAASLTHLAREAGLTVSLLIAPTTPFARAEAITRACTGFVYLLARAGITGDQGALDASALAQRVDRLRAMTTLPIACGFGISTPSHVRDVLRHADAAIVGSSLVRRITDAANAGTDVVPIAADFVAELVAASRLDR